MSLLYRDILKAAWGTTKRYRSLWFFGLFAAPVANGGVFELLYQSLLLNPITDGNWSGAVIETISRMNLIDSIAALVGRLSHINDQGQPSLLLLTTVALGSVVLVWLTIVSIDALVNGARLASKNETLTIRQGLKSGHTSFWAIAGASAVALLLINLIFLVIRGLLSVPTGNLGVTIPVALLILLLMAVLAGVYFITFYTIAFIILKRAPLVKAATLAVELLRQYWLVNIELSALLYVIALATGFVGTYIISLFIKLPLTFILYSLSSSGAVGPSGIEALMLFLQLATAFLILALWGIVSVFQLSSWTLLFLQLNKKTVFESKTARISRTIQGMVMRPQSTDVLE